MKDVKQVVQWLNDELRTYLERLHAPETLKEAMKYSLLAGGKKILSAAYFRHIRGFSKTTFPRSTCCMCRGNDSHVFPYS